MIPQKAIKKFTKDAHREIVVGHLLAYGFYPRTTEGIDQAKKFVAGLDQWIAPSDLPNYYNDIESDLMTGRETAGIVNIRMILEDFYFGGGAGTPANEEPQEVPVEMEIVEVEQKEPDEPIVVKVEAPFENPVSPTVPRRIRLPRVKNTIKVPKEKKKDAATRMAEAFDKNLDNLLDNIRNPDPTTPPRVRKPKQTLVKKVRTKKLRAAFDKTDPYQAKTLSGFLGLKLKKSFGRAAEARRLAKESGAEEKGKRYFLKKALGFEFGGDKLNRLQGTFSKSPVAAKDPALTADQRFLAGIAPDLTPPEVKQGTLFDTNKYTTKTGVAKVVADGIDKLKSSFDRTDQKFRSIIEIKKGSVQSDLSKLSGVVEDLKKSVLKNVDTQKDINDTKQKQLDLLFDIVQDEKADAKEASMEKGEDLSGQLSSATEERQLEQAGKDGGGFDLGDMFDKFKKFKWAKWLRRLRNPGRFMRSLGRLGRMRFGQFMRPAANLGRGALNLGRGALQGAMNLGRGAVQGVGKFVGGGAATTAAIVGGAGLAASAIGEGFFQLTKKGGAGEQARDYLKKKGEEMGGPLGALVGGMGNLAGISNEATKVTGNILDVVGAPFRYAIEGIRYPFLNEEDREKQAENLAKFDARIRENIRGGLNRIDVMNVVPDEKGGFGNIYGRDEAQKEMMEKMSEGGTIPKFQAVGGARLTGDLPTAGGVNAMIGEAGPEMLLRAGQGAMNPLQSLAPMILAAREVTKRAGTWADPIENLVRQTTDPIAKSLNLPVSPIQTDIGQGSVPQMEEKPAEDDKGPLGWLAKLFKKGKKKIGRRGSRSAGINPIPVTGIPLGPGQTAQAGELVAGLMSRGFAREEAAAIVGNLWAESGFNTGAVNPSSGAFGLMQWLGGRKTRLIAFARERNKDVKDLGLQLDYIAWELKGGNQYETSQFQKAMAYGSDVASKTRGFAMEVERAGAHELEASMSKRIGAGQSAFNSGASSTPPAPPVAATPPAAPPQPLLPPTTPSIVTLPLPAPAPRPAVSSIFSTTTPPAAIPSSYDELRLLAMGIR